MALSKNMKIAIWSGVALGLVTGSIIGYNKYSKKSSQKKSALQKFSLSSKPVSVNTIVVNKKATAGRG